MPIQVSDQNSAYFLTLTIEGWMDIFTRKEYKLEVVNSLNFCVERKGLEIFAWVIMSNHCHLILRAKEENLADIIRDLKKFTAKAIVRLIQENELESRKKWLAMTLTFENHIWFWEKGYHGEEIYSIPFYNPKMNKK